MCYWPGAHQVGCANWPVSLSTILLSLAPECRDCKHVPLHPVFIWVLGFNTGPPAYLGQWMSLAEFCSIHRLSAPGGMDRGSKRRVEANETLLALLSGMVDPGFDDQRTTPCWVVS